MRLSLVLLCAWVWLGAAAFAQDSAPTSEDAATTAETLHTLTGQERTDLVARLSDAQARDLLLFYLDKTAETPKPAASPTTLLANVEKSGVVVRQNAVATVASVVEVPAALGSSYSRLAEEAGFPGIILLIIALILFIGVGYGAERLYAAGVSGIRRDLKASANSADAGQLLAAVLAFVLDLLGLAVFVAGYVLAFLVVWQGDEERRQLAAAVLLAIATVRLVGAAAELMFLPESAGHRLIPLDRAGAQYFKDRATRIAIVAAATLIPAFLIGVWSGDRYVRALLVSTAGGAFVGYFATVIWRGRHHAATAFLSVWADGETPPIGMRLLARSWAGLIACYAVVLYLAMLAAAMAEKQVNILSFLGALLVVVVGIPVVDNLIGLALSRRDRAMKTSTGATLTWHGSQILRRAARIVVAVVAALVVLNLLGVDLITAANRTLGAWIARLVFDIGVVILIAYLLWEFAVAAINRKLAEEIAATDAHGAPDAIKASRLTTILPLFRRALQLAIVVIAGLMVLSSLGIDIVPMLAGAGIVGLAVGFGSQTLVKDLISGLFFLIDDAFRAGEYIAAGDVDGTVERINVRSLSLRTPAGAIHTVPYGGIREIANYSRDWAVMKIEFKVTYDTDLAKVRRIFKQIGEELGKDPELAQSFLQPFKFQGVKSMDETGIIVRGKFVALPGTQFQIRKQVFERVYKAFAAEGIRFAQRRVQVDLPLGSEHLDPLTKEAIERASAAAAAV